MQYTGKRSLEIYQLPRHEIQYCQLWLHEISSSNLKGFPPQGINALWRCVAARKPLVSNDLLVDITNSQIIEYQTCYHWSNERRIKANSLMRRTQIFNCHAMPMKQSRRIWVNKSKQDTEKCVRIVLVILYVNIANSLSKTNDNHILLWFQKTGDRKRPNPNSFPHKHRSTKIFSWIITSIAFCGIYWFLHSLEWKFNSLRPSNAYIRQ